MYKRMWGLVAAAALIAACSSDSSGGGGGPDLTGTWNLISVDLDGSGANPAIPAPPASGQFIFANGKDVDISITIPDPFFPGGLVLIGTGTYTQTKTKLNINSGVPLIGQALGTYQFAAGGGPNGGDLLTVDMLASGQHTFVVVERP